jgi:adenylate cyclase
VSPLLEAAQRRLLSAPWRSVALLAVAGIAVAAAMWSLRSPPVANAAHYAILGRSILASERSAKANREALALFSKALALDPDWVPALLGYADVMVIQVGGEWVPLEERPARLDQAEAAIERALAREPANALAHHLKGVLLRMRGDPDRAAAAFERSLALNAGNAWTHAEFGRTKIELGRAGEALADIETALRLHPSEAAIHVWYCWAGMAALHAGRNEQAVHWLLKARETRPSYPLPVPLLAVAYAETGREAEGRALIVEHLTRAPSLTMQTLRRDYPARNSIVAKQRERIADVLRRLGVPDARVRTGSTH